MRKLFKSDMIHTFFNLRFMALLCLVVNCSTADKTIPKVKCTRCSSDVTVDGYGDEWTQTRSSIINDRTTLAVCKDNKFIYISMITSDPEFSMQIMNYGLTLWFDVRDNKKRELGIQFPVTRFVPPPPKDGKPPAGEELQKFLNERLKDIALNITGSSKVRSMEIDEAVKYGIDANIGIDGQTLSYELKYPVRNSVKDSLGLALDNKLPSLNICIETPKIDFNKIMQESGDNKQPPQGMTPPPGTKPAEGQQPPPGARPPEAGAPPKEQEPSGVERLQEVSNQNLRPKPPQIKRISQWVEISFI